MSTFLKETCFVNTKITAAKATHKNNAQWFMIMVNSKLYENSNDLFMANFDNEKFKTNIVL